MTVAEKMKTLIDDKGVSYTFISSKTGIPIDAISRSMLGKRRLPAEEMIAICRAVGIDLYELSDSDMIRPRIPHAPN